MTKKKDEDLEQGNNELTQVTWADILKTKKQKKSQRNYETPATSVSTDQQSSTPTEVPDQQPQNTNNFTGVLAILATR